MQPLGKPADRMAFSIVHACMCGSRDVSGFSEMPYAVALLNTAIWVCYAVSTPGRLAAFVTNMLGLTLEVFKFSMLTMLFLNFSNLL
jgi:hypothetical protein